MAPNVPAGRRIYAIGDIHGRADLLARLYAMIFRDAEGAEVLGKTLVYLGDYIDRGPDSRQVIDMLLAPLPRGFRAVHLRGNHDAWLVDFLADIAAGPGWLNNGGHATLASYGVGRPLGLTLASRLSATQAALDRALPEAHRRFFQGLGDWHVEGDYLFVHAGIRPGVALDRQTPDDLLWIRDEFLYSDADHGHIVVHGHTIRDEPELMANRIGIDTGAFMSGRLTAAVFERASVRFLAT
ncbi:MAG: serine/threonine protein phosphatase [Alphaproteobacteria bacterium]|nr:serine/threonine protein phosphatase [Alphaproteobacteria bacterium]